MLSFGYILTIIAPIFIIIAMGSALRRGGLLTEEADASLLRLTVNILLPALVLNLILGNEALMNPVNILVPPVLGFISIALATVLAWAVAPLAGLKESARRTFAFCAGIQNYGYVPLPICLALFGRDTAAVLLGFSLGVEFALWLVGVNVLTGRGGLSSWKKALTPPVVAIVAGMVLNLTGAWIWVPSWIDQSLGMLGACAVPLALMLTGAVFADFAGRGSLTGGARVIGLAAVVRLLIMPMVLLLAAKFLPLDRDLRIVLVLQAAMPAAVAPMAITKHYGGDLLVALRVILSNTLLGIATIPIWLQIGLRWLELYPR